MPIVRTDTKRASALPAPRRAAPAEPARAPGVGAWPIWAGGAAVTAAVGWFAFNLPGPRGPAALGWLPALFAMAVAAVGCWATAGTPGLSRGAVRFWRQMALVAGFSAVGLAIRAVYIVPLGAGPHAASYLPMATMLFTHTAVVLGVWALLRVPVGRLTAGDWLRLLLDALIVVLGAGLVIWYATIGPQMLAPDRTGPVWGPLFVAGLCLVGLSAVAKIILAGAGPVDLGALRLIGIGLLVGGLSSGSASLLADTSSFVPGQIAVPVIATLMAAGARRQALVTAGGRAPLALPRRQRRQFSLLPYAALLATETLLLIATMPAIGLRGRVVVLGAVTITLVVAIRQVTAFTDNARLVGQLRSQEDRLRHQADHDSLTQLANRAVFAERLDEALAGHAAERIAVLLIDLDDFKSVNDTLGHAVGDQLLLEVAARLRACVRPGDMVARLGGDEFGVLLCGAELGTPDAVAGRVLGTLAPPILADDHQLLVRASIGIAVPEPDDTSGTVLRNADIAMYAAKERGKGSYLRYVPGMATNVLEHARLGAQLREAIDRRNLFAVFQPVMHLREHRIIGMETLVRWNHPVRGVVPPGGFIPTAERTGLVVPLGRWLLAEACGRLAAWRAEYGTGGPFTIGVNVSGRQLAEPSFAADTAAAVLDAGLEPHNVVLEVTEDSVLTGGEVIDTLRELHEFGVKIALDDFGTGQSSLGLLRSCPVDILKLDKSFVDGIAEGTQQAAIATAVIGMAQALGLDAVAEGIENEAQATFLAELGYHLGQGFHLAPPRTADEIVSLFSRPPRDPSPHDPSPRDLGVALVNKSD